MSRQNKQIGEGQNRLALEQSPYLLQHADNPVDWYPWGEEAFKKAKQEDKPIFLSIGYSTCHWCHVMEHESFEDSTVAGLMNDAFINVKVDREERPDIDNIYMTVCQMMTGRGGWPLTIVMTPDKKPFFAATYIPKDNRFGGAGMVNLIPQIQSAWETRRNEIFDASDRITGRLREYAAGQDAGADLTAATLDLGNEQLSDRFDAKHGGFGGAPKFPTPHHLLFLLRHWKRTGAARTLEMVEKTLEEMSRGGIYDHVGFGFHRYSTDARWFAPHFEKMLYDQALLLMAYAEAYQATGNELYRRVGEEIITYVLRDMTDESGGFYSAEDADSEGVEGKFYLWTQREVQTLLGEEEAELVIDAYGIEAGGNFAEEVRSGNILYLERPLSQVAAERGASEQEIRDRLERIRVGLFDEREKRIHPHKDDKVLTDWNGLMIAAMAKAARAFDNEEYTATAERALKFIVKTMRGDQGELFHRYRQGVAGIPATVDDYAFLIWGLLELYENTFDVDHLQTAVKLNGDLIDRFWDDQNGGLFFTADGGEELIARMKEVQDGAIPSGNSVTMLNLLRLGRLTANPQLEERAAAIGRAFFQQVSEAPSAFTQLLLAVDFAVGPSFEVVIVGKPGAKDTRAMQRALNSVYLPRKVTLYKPSDEKSPEITKLATFTKDHQAIEGKATAYVCRNYACDLPTTDVEQMLRSFGDTAD
ncbi:MAG: thioredoxin domain-containing protein [Candidatus Krumholzibacteria bacterium]|nr:thioredoxin domain-containing protein [Candidatus Krumholzibacteria bacterium]